MASRTGRPTSSDSGGTLSCAIPPCRRSPPFPLRRIRRPWPIRERIALVKITSSPFWRSHRDKILYLVVGAWNTLFQYVLFSICWYSLGEHVHPDLVLLIAYLIGSLNGFLGFRYVVFGHASHPLVEYLRFQLVYLPLLALNMIVLPLLLRHTSLNAYAIQALFAVFVVVAAYLGNKYFTFRRPRSSRHGLDAP